MSAYFITGTGTDIGKTWLCAALLRHWRAQDVAVRAAKPVMSGFAAQTLAASDAGVLLQATGQALTPEAVAAMAPWRFAAPLSPDMAAAAEGRAIDFAALCEHSRHLARPSTHTLTLIEGVGGVMVPLDAHHTVLDWMTDTALPVVLVAGSYLGSLSHTLTALQALRSRALPLAAVVINETPDSSVPLDAALASLTRHAGSVPVLAIERAAPAAGVAAVAHILHPS